MYSLVVVTLGGSLQAQVVDGLIAALQEQSGHFVQMNSEQVERSGWSIVRCARYFLYNKELEK